MVAVANGGTMIIMGDGDGGMPPMGGGCLTDDLYAIPYISDLYAMLYNLTLYAITYKITLYAMLYKPETVERDDMEIIARTRKDIGAAVQRFRKSTALSQSALASRAGIDRQPTVSDLESGAKSVNVDVLLDVLRALDLELVIRERSKAGKSIRDVF